MEASREPRRGDPAFEGSDAITHAPIDEAHRFDNAEGAAVLRRPAPRLVLALIVTIVVLGVVLGAVAGWAYVIPFLIVAALAAVAASVGWWMQRRPEQVPDEVPNFVVTEEQEVGGGHDQRDERSSHEDMERSTGGAG
jgi:hypothetical protein